MRKIAIVGAGQSGLQLALGLQSHGYQVTLMTNRTAEEVHTGKVMSTQVMFPTALQHERDLGLNFWESQTPRIEGIGVSVAEPDGSRPIDWVGRLHAYGQSVDQRVKMAGWMETFAERGGRLVIQAATLSNLDDYAASHDLVLVAAGRGELVDIFDRDASRSPYDVPQRALSSVYVHGLAPRPEHPDFLAVRFNIVPNVGEMLVMPTFTTSGPADILAWEGIPGGPLDVFEDIKEPDKFLQVTLELMERFVPWEYERTRGVELTDANGTLAGRFAPTVRNATAELPSGAVVMGVADTVVLNDPITGQGSNSAAKCAAVYLDSILANSDKPFDRDWMQSTFDHHWQYAQHVTKWTNAMLAPPPEHVLNVIGAAGQLQPVAERFVNGFDDPTDFENWFFDPELAQTFLAEVS